jgi:hypothetical protein
MSAHHIDEGRIKKNAHIKGKGVENVDKAYFHFLSHVKVHAHTPEVRS